MIAYPPSPAISTCDSLANIDDLDEYLESQGQLSHWPTPPQIKQEWNVQEIEIDVDDEDDGLDYTYIAAVFTREASIGAEANDVDVALVRRILERSLLPPELIAFAFDIICGLGCRSLPAGSFHSAPSDLLVVSALSLAVTYCSDHPPSFSDWSRHACAGTWTAVRIDKTGLLILAALDWRLHDLSNPQALQKTITKFTVPVRPYTIPVEVYDLGLNHLSPDSKHSDPLEIVIEEMSVHLTHGLITAEETSSPSAFEELEDRFLPLL